MDLIFLFFTILLVLILLSAGDERATKTILLNNIHIDRAILSISPNTDAKEKQLSSLNKKIMDIKENRPEKPIIGIILSIILLVISMINAISQGVINAQTKESLITKQSSTGNSS